MPCALNPFPPQYVIYSHKCLWIDSKFPSHMLYVAFLPPNGTCVPLALHLFLTFHFWSLSLTSNLSADWTVTKLVLSLPFQLPFLLDPTGGGSIFRASRCWGQKWHKCQLKGGNILTVEHKLCRCYDILLVILILSTPKLVKNINIYPCCQKKLQIDKCYLPKRRLWGASVNQAFY